MASESFYNNHHAIKKKKKQHFTLILSRFYYWKHYYYSFISCKTQNIRYKYTQIYASTTSYTKVKKKNLFYNLENLKSYNPINKANLWYVTLTEFRRRLLCFHRLTDWFNDARDSCCFITFWL